jgi:hypothetical protein
MREDERVPRPERREAIRRLVRYASLGGLALGTGALAARRQIRACPGSSVCEGCPALSDCRLPKAEAHRAAR